MKRKYLTISATSKDRGAVYFQVTNQSHICGEFADETESGFTRYTFYAKNGIKLKSVGGPEWRPEESVLFVRGSYEPNDTKTLVASPWDFELIQEAVNEYNQHFGSVVTICLPDELFVVE